MLNVTTLLETKKLTEILTKQNKIDQLIDTSGQFADEPFLHYYTFLKGQKVGGGISMFSSQVAIVKALHEFVERMTLFEGPHFTSNQLLEVRRLDNNKKSHFLKDLIYFSQKPSSFEVTSCGTASGFSKEKTKVKAITELIDADTAMLWFFKVIEGSLIDLKQFNDNKLHYLINQLEWYKLEPLVIQVINEIGIPSYISFIIDKTNHQPAVSTGLGNGIFGIEGLIHSIEEALHSRLYIKNILIQKEFFKENYSILSKDLRSFYWADHKNKKYILNRIHNLKKTNFKYLNTFKTEKIIADFLSNNVTFYLADITPKFLKTINYVVYKIITSELQPLYLDEKLKTINKSRIKQINRNFDITTIADLPPHPFL